MASKLLALALLTPLVALPPAPLDAPPSTYESCGTALGSEVCTWVVLDGDDVVELGATIPMHLIEAVPADAEMVWPPQAMVAIALPPEARSALGMDHMEVNWEAHGHPPRLFMTPHFDFHFYSISQAEVGTIDCSDETKPAALPLRYSLPDVEVPGMGTLIGLCVPHMGMHAMLEADVGATDDFDASMMLGYYGGRPVFFEPMVARKLLMKKADFDLPMPAVEGLPAGVHYPNRFRGEFDAAGDAYRLVFSDFRAH